MATKAEVLATRFETNVRAAAAVLVRLCDADWKKTTTAETWTVGVTAHHLASAYEAVSGIVTSIASGGSRGHFTSAMLDELNARHAKEHAGCTKRETLAHFPKTAPAAAGDVRGLGDDQLAKSGIVFDDVPPMTTEQLITRALIDHTGEHLRSIQETVSTRGT